ncbi:hypothetical protein [Candidatus Poriferisocius sp.]|uniref:hypothetical protein n=1 Tax=Candidatus Poriferisocius sp. TaxID=3101276 RepID=UPI003B516917
MRSLLLLGFVALSAMALSSPGNGVDGFDHFGVEQWRPLVAEYFPPDEVDDVLSVMGCESHGNPNTHFMEEWGQYSIGLMQINEGWLTGWSRPEWSILSHNGQPVDLADPATNMQAAKFVRYYEDTTGLDPWSQWACQPE